MALRDKVFERVGDAADLTAFEIPLHAPRFIYPTEGQWAQLNPPLGTLPQEESAPALSRPRLPAKWERYVGDKERPFARLLRKDRLPGETKARATKRVAKVKSYLGSVGSFVATSNRHAKRGAPGEHKWRWEITGKIERTATRGGRELIAEGTQVGPWQTVAAGETVPDKELRAAYYDVARAAIRTQTVKTTSDGRHGPGEKVSAIYKGDSDEAIFTPTKIRIVLVLSSRVRPDGTVEGVDDVNGDA